MIQFCTSFKFIKSNRQYISAKVFIQRLRTFQSTVVFYDSTKVIKNKLMH